MYFYQSSMCVACATGGTAAVGLLLVMMGVGKDQTLRGRRRWFSCSNHRLLQQRSEVQTNRQSPFSQLENILQQKKKKKKKKQKFNITSLNRKFLTPPPKKSVKYKVTHLCPGVMWFSAAGAHEEVNTLVSESCRRTQRQTHNCYTIKTYLLLPVCNV